MTAPTRPPQQTLRQLREDRGWTQEDLANRLGVKRSLVQTWETGKRLPRAMNRWRLAQVFGRSVSEIAFFWTGGKRGARAVHAAPRRAPARWLPRPSGCLPDAPNRPWRHIRVVLGDEFGNVRIPGSERVFCRPLDEQGQPQHAQFAILPREVTYNDQRLPIAGTIVVAKRLGSAQGNYYAILANSLPAKQPDPRWND